MNQSRGWRVWLSGASSGIGEALARELALGDCRLALFARREERLRSLAQELRAARQDLEVIVQAGDVRDAARVREAVAEAEARFGGIDVLILNAGTGDTMTPEEFDPGLIDRIMDINFMGAIHGIAAALPGMLRRESGTIVGVSSIAGTRGLPGSGPYCASKAAFTTFLESLRLDLRGTGVRVVTVSPGFIKTPLTDRNRYRMPFLQPADRSARIIVKGIARGKREIHFPKRLTIPVKLLRCVPGQVYDFLVSRLIRGGFRKERAED